LATKAHLTNIKAEPSIVYEKSNYVGGLGRWWRVDRLRWSTVVGGELIDYVHGESIATELGRVACENRGIVHLDRGIVHLDEASCTSIVHLDIV